MSEFKYVPVEPTEEMLTAAYLSTGNKYYWTKSYFIEGYKAAISAAPAQPSPAESDKEAVRNAALEEAAKACSNESVEVTDRVTDTAYNNALIHATQAIRDLKTTSVSEVSQPAQPSDTEMLDWIIEHNATVEASICTRPQFFVLYYLADGTGEVQATSLENTPREAIKAAMQAQEQS